MRLSDAEVCVLGGGIAGALTACLLHDAGCRDVTIVDRSGAVMAGASRWNEGKVHLGFTYTGVADLATARLMISGAAAFEPVLRQVTGSDLPREWWTDPVVYLVDEQSIFPMDVLWDRTQATAALLAEAAENSADLRQHLTDADAPLLTRLPVEQAMRETRQHRVAAGWRTAERAVAPRPVAERLCHAAEERAINLIEGNVQGLRNSDDRWHVDLSSGATIIARVVVNCLWESHALIDNLVGASPKREVTIRYKSGIFATDAPAWRGVAPSTRILGKFGDITPYGNGDLYMSWYPAALAMHCRGEQPPALPPLDEQRIRRGILDGLGLGEQWAATLNGNSIVRGGFVVASGDGDISEQASGLHHRSEPDAREVAPGYVSVETGKYTLGPLLARKAADVVLARLGLR